MVTMHEQDELSSEEFFPAVESFSDFSGKQREFVIELMVQATGYFLRAREKRRAGDEGGYEFAAYSPASPFFALSTLRDKIRKGMATRYLDPEHGQGGLSHDRLKGRISHSGVVVDGRFISFEEFSSLLAGYEGSQFSLTVTDPYDEEPRS
jgi:hypothetical protein